MKVLTERDFNKEILVYELALVVALLSYGGMRSCCTDNKILENYFHFLSHFRCLQPYLICRHRGMELWKVKASFMLLLVYEGKFTQVKGGTAFTFP